MVTTAFCVSAVMATADGVTVAAVTATPLTRLIKDGVQFQVFGKADKSQFICQRQHTTVLLAKRLLPWRPTPLPAQSPLHHHDCHAIDFVTVAPHLHPHKTSEPRGEHWP